MSKEIAQQIREKAKIFIDWLEQASEEEEEEEDEEEEEVSNLQMSYFLSDIYKGETIG